MGFVGFVGWELEGCHSPLRFLFVEWPLMALWGKIGFCRKPIFQAPKNCFFAHVWTASSPLTIYAWIELGTWNIVFRVMWLWKADERKPQENHKLADPRGCATQAPSRFELKAFNPEDWCPTRCATGPLPPEKFAFLLSELAARGWGLVWVAVAKKKSRPDKLFSTLPWWNSLAPAFAKAWKHVFSVCPLINLPTPPRYLV